MQQDEYLTSIGNDLFNIENIVFNWHIPEQVLSGDVKKTNESAEEGSQLKLADDKNCENVESWTKENLLKETRKFNIDLTPKVIIILGCNSNILISLISSYNMQEVILWNYLYLPILPVIPNTGASVEF